LDDHFSEHTVKRLAGADPVENEQQGNGSDNPDSDHFNRLRQAIVKRALLFEAAEVGDSAIFNWVFSYERVGISPILCWSARCVQDVVDQNIMGEERVKKSLPC